REGFKLLLAQRAHFLFKLVYPGQMRSRENCRWDVRTLGADIAELANVALVAGAEEAGLELGDPFGKGGETIADLLQNTNIHRAFGLHISNASARCLACGFGWAKGLITQFVSLK